MQGEQAEPSAEASAMKQVWGLIMTAFIVWFAKSCIEQIAQQRQAEKDGDIVEVEMKID